MSRAQIVSVSALPKDRLSKSVRQYLTDFGAAECRRDLNSRLPLAVPEMRFSRYRSTHFDRGAFPLLAVSATGGARKESLTRGSRGHSKSCLKTRKEK